MALALLTTTAFVQDLRRLKKQGKDLDKLDVLVTSSGPANPTKPLPRSPVAGQLGKPTGIATSSRIGSFSTN
jgi:hypothetical protein